MKCVVMINCGGCFNVLDLLQPDSDVKFYIIDRYLMKYTIKLQCIYFMCSYRPLLLENIYNHGQVCVFLL